jgi:GTP cyclohydrolase IA
MVDENKIKKAITLILEAIGENPEREGLKETPDRIARMYTEIFSGFEDAAKNHLSKTFQVEENNVVIEKDIQFYSMCEHHLLPFFGKVHIAYIPDGRVAGLSKLARTVEVYSKRPQLQERLTSEIAEAIYSNLKAKAVLVVIEAEHLCMNMRGIKKPGSITKTIASKGLYKEDISLRKEALNLIFS